eukprot:CAMPEP_0178899262 /NCGR_PEP_ID=MMETSP0786-20121207/2798_1 /TAXON_ID=186022 /ORGANISM="Thalassionema frauenfeldii, Strain CCMP 1798" /LENGTH=519 /DNA_ID=CAMNT_0020570091 /DNA_START=154 /DNA_END=1714 /DNA_ORIENTATION=-
MGWYVEKKQSPFSALGMSVLDEEEKVIEESRREVLQSRRLSIRSTLRSAENFRNFRLSKGWVPELDPETGEPVSSDGKTAVTFTAFAVAAGAIALRLGGRAALISAVGLDFAKDNPELKQQLEQVLGYANSLDFGTEVFFFALAWTAVKVFCFDAGGIVLAIASGVIFGGVWQGALASAASATVGSLVCFGLAKLDTPVRKQALSVVEEYPSLRGIERVVAQDGFKAILTLRLAPVLPIPLGLYNYVYGVTNVPVFDFAAGIFLGSLKPYLLDSYLGYFGKAILDGSAASEAVGMQDIILLFAIGLSVLIGVFASQLAGETWDTVLKEIEEEEKLKNPEQEEELIRVQVAGIDLPEWMVDWQVQWGMAEERMLNLVDAEMEAQVWNFSKPELIPTAQNPALAPDSPEVRNFGKGFDFGANTMDGLVLSPVLFSVFTKFSDPLYAAETQSKTQHVRRKFFDLDIKRRRGGNPKAVASVEKVDISMQKERLLERLSKLKSRTQRRLDRLNSAMLAQESEDS